MQKKSFYWMMAAILICGMWWRFSTAASSAPVPAAAVAGLVCQVPVIYDNAKIWRFFRWNKNFAVFRLSLLRQLPCFATNQRHSKESRRKSSPINYSRASNILQYDRYQVPVIYAKRVFHLSIPLYIGIPSDLWGMRSITAFCICFRNQKLSPWFYAMIYKSLTPRSAIFLRLRRIYNLNSAAL